MAPQPEGHIYTKVMCLFTKDGKTLGGKGYDSVDQEEFFRILGGSIEFGETHEEAMRREIREELNCEIENLEFIEAFENIFTYHGKPGHNIVFLYKGELSNKDLYNQESITIIEEAYEPFEAQWVSVDDVISGKVAFYPAYNYSKVLK